MIWDGKITFNIELFGKNDDGSINKVDIGTVGTYDGDNSINWTRDNKGFMPNGDKSTKGGD